METWKDIPGFENVYQVSDIGRLRSLSRFSPTRWKTKRWISGKILKTYSRWKYLCIGLRVNGKVRTYSVHGLVLSAFVGQRESGKVVNHKDGNKLNNRLNNLEYCTETENVCHARDVLGIHYGEYAERRVRQYSLGMTLLKEHHSISSAARETGALTSHITEVCGGKRLMKQTHGFIWRYVD